MCFVYTIFPKNSDCKSTNYFLTKNFFVQLIFNIRKLIIFRVFHVAQTNKNVSLQGQILKKKTRRLLLRIVVLDSRPAQCVL